MAAKFNVPYLGKLPMDHNMLRACEEGRSVVDAYPDSLVVAPFKTIVQTIAERMRQGLGVSEG